MHHPHLVDAPGTSQHPLIEAGRDLEQSATTLRTQLKQGSFRRKAAAARGDKSILPKAWPGSPPVTFAEARAASVPVRECRWLVERIGDDERGSRFARLPFLSHRRFALGSSSYSESEETSIESDRSISAIGGSTAIGKSQKESNKSSR